MKKPPVPPSQLPWEWTTNVVKPHRRKLEFEVVVNGQVIVRGQAWNAIAMLAECLTHAKGKVEVRRL